MATTSETITYDSFFTSTIKNYEKGLYKNFLEFRPTVMLLMDQYRNKNADGGRLWQGSAEYGSNPNVKFFAGADTFDQQPTQTAQPLIYEWRYLGASISISRTEQLENSGPVALFDLTESRIRQALRTANLVLGTEIFSDGTNYNGKTIVGFQAGISSTPTTGTVGGLNSATFPFWRNNARTSCGSWAANGVNGTANDYVLTDWNNCTDGMTEKPAAIVTSQSVWESYNKTLLQPVRFVDEIRGTGDLTFTALEYQGRKFYWDRQCPTGYLYMLNPSHVHFKTDPRMMFTWTEPLTYPNQMTFTRIMGLRLCLTYTSRMFLAVQTGWTA